jgi:hypothetical protein
VSWRRFCSTNDRDGFIEELAQELRKNKEKNRERTKGGGL